MPKAAVHLWGGKALVKISAACSLVSTYRRSMFGSDITSLRLLRFTLWVRDICLSFGEKPLRTTRIVAWLSSCNLQFYGALKQHLP